MIERFKRERGKEEVRPATINRAVALWKHFVSRALAEEWISEATAKNARNVTMLKEPPGRVRYLSDDETRTSSRRFARMFVTCRDHCGLLTGMRRGEILSLRKTAVDLSARLIRLTETKTNKARFIPIHENLVEILRGGRAVMLGVRVLTEGWEAAQSPHRGGVLADRRQTRHRRPSLPRSPPRLTRGSQWRRARCNRCPPWTHDARDDPTLRAPWPRGAVFGSKRASWYRQTRGREHLLNGSRASTRQRALAMLLRTHQGDLPVEEPRSRRRMTEGRRIRWTKRHRCAHGTDPKH